MVDDVSDIEIDELIIPSDAYFLACDEINERELDNEAVLEPTIYGSLDPSRFLTIDIALEDIIEGNGESRYGKRGSLPLYSGSHDDVGEVLQFEQGVTNADASRPVIATFGLGPCVALVGYDVKSATGFVAHYCDGMQLEESMDDLHTSVPEGDYEVRIISADEEISGDFVKELIRISEKKGYRIIEKDVSGSGDFSEVKSVALDTRTGEVTRYQHEIRELTPIEKARVDDITKKCYSLKPVTARLLRFDLGQNYK